MKSIVEELEYLTSIPALSGMEDRMIAEMVSRFRSFTDEVEVDRLGNVTATFRGQNEAEPTLLLFAHVDELGLMVTKIEPSGFLRFDRIGGVPEKTLRGALVDVHSIDGSMSFTGFVGTHAHHLTPADQKYAVPTTDKMYIDLGLGSSEEVFTRCIRVGSAVTYHPGFHRIGDYRVTSKALDNRIGVLMLLALAEHMHQHPPKATVYLVASVQEEFNIRGNMPVFTRLEPNAAICLDITSACDTPDLNMRYDIALGKGPAILQMNFHGRGELAGLIPHPRLRLFLERTLEELDIPYQRQTIIGEVTDDAFTLVLGKYGVAMAHISIPMRYSHSPIETSDLRDIEAGIRLVKEIVDRFDHTLDLRRGIW
jgi:putative aminopeptidase FrvX